MKAWTELDPKAEYNMDLNDKRSLRNYTSFIENSMDLGALDGYANGMDKYTREALYGFIFYPLYIAYVDEHDLSRYVCTMMWYEEGPGFEECLQ